MRDPEIRATVMEALRSKRGLDITYRDMYGRVTSRAILGFTVYEYRGGEYLMAYCWLRKDQRDFQLRGILRATLRSKDVPITTYVRIRDMYKKLRNPLVGGFQYVFSVDLEGK